MPARKRKWTKGTRGPKAIASSEPPKRCPRCNGRRLVCFAPTPSGILAWRCPKCRAIGYEDRILGDPIPPALPKAKIGKRTHRLGRFARAPAPEKQGREEDEES